ncbi:MAG: HlyC/CorC family transporter [Deltaproteobacteria bacterium]|nr:HlyC/CorC family transporter [Deltaproteobacteria bacterium]
MVSVAMLVSVALVIANAFFVASEFALVKMRPSRLEQLAAKGHRRARLALRISRRLDAYLSANQLGITLASLALGWIGEPAFAELLKPLFASLGPWSVATAHAVAVIVSLAAITFLHTVLGELVPKSLAIQRTEAVALWTAAPLRVFYLLMFPVIWVLNTASWLVLRMFGLRRTKELEVLHSPEELRLILQHVKLDPGAWRVMDRLFDYTHGIARHVMTLRRDIVVLDARRSWEDNLAVALGQQYTRYPVIDGEADRVLGYVHLKDIVNVLGLNRRHRSMRELVREPIFASEETSLEQLRREFMRRRIHLAVIRGADESFIGIVTLEDLLEEFVGEIQDEQDAGEVPPIVSGRDGSYEVDGRLTIDVAARELGLHLPEVPRGVDTVGAYVTASIVGPLQAGAAMTCGSFRLIVLEAGDGIIRRLRVEPVLEPPIADPAPP